VLVIHVAVVYFLFLIGIMVVGVVLTIVVQRLHFRSEIKPLTAMPIWVSTNVCVYQIRLHFAFY